MERLKNNATELNENNATVKVHSILLSSAVLVLPPFENDSPFSVNRDFPGKFVYT